MKELEEFLKKMLSDKVSYNTDRETTIAYIEAVKNISTTYIHKGLCTKESKESNCQN